MPHGYGFFYQPMWPEVMNSLKVQKDPNDFTNPHTFAFAPAFVDCYQHSQPHFAYSTQLNYQIMTEFTQLSNGFNKISTTLIELHSHPHQPLVSSYQECSNCIDTVNFHLIEHDSEIAIFVSDRDRSLLRGIRESSARDTHLPCVGGLDVALVAMMAKGCVLLCEKVEYKVNDETASLLQADKIHEKTGLTDFEFFENINKMVDIICEGTENADDKFKNFWKQFIWLRDAMMSDEKVEGESLNKLKDYVKLLGNWAHDNLVISSIKETLESYVAMAEDDDEIEIFFKYMSVYPVEKVMFELKATDASGTQSNF